MKEESTQDIKRRLAKGRSLWSFNFNIWLFIGITLCFWFTGIHGVPLLFKGIGPMFFIHLVNSTLISWICVINHLYTPDHSSMVRKLHVKLGKLSLITGILSTALGFGTTWYERYQGVTTFAISISIGGVIQVLAQLISLYYIRKRNVKMHIYTSHFVFFSGCLIPAIMRLPILLGYDLPPYWNAYSPIFVLTLGRLSYNAFINRSWY